MGTQKQEFVEQGATKVVAGASLREPVAWHDINWKQAHRNERRLQARIVKAKKEGKKRKVRALRFILTCSLSARALAVKRVTTNRGKRTPGVDGEVWDTPHQKAQAVAELRTKGYRPQPLRRKAIPKKNGGHRFLGIPTMKDRAMQALYALVLDPIAEMEVRLSTGTVTGRRHRAMFWGAGQADIGPVGVGRRHPGVLRRAGARMAADPHSAT